MSTATDREQALCCECGTLRMLGGSHPARVGDTSGLDGSTGMQAQWMAERGLGRFDRCVCRAKCATCNTVTTHAYLRTDDRRDYLETQLYNRPHNTR